METPNQSYTRTALIIAFAAAAVIIIMVWWFYGATGIFNVIKKLIFWLVIAGIIGLIGFLVYWLLKQHKLDMVHIHRQRIIQACEANQVDYRQTVHLRPVGEDWASRYVGDVVGMCMIQSQPQREVLPNKDGSKDYKVAKPDNPYEELVFVAVRPPGLINRYLAKFLDRISVLALAKGDHTALSGSIIYLNGMTFSPALFGMLWLSHHWERRHFIDETVKENIYRYTLQENLKDMATIVDDAIDASPSYKKKQETQMIQQVPVIDRFAPGGGQR